MFDAGIPGVGCLIQVVYNVCVTSDGRKSALTFKQDTMKMTVFAAPVIKIWTLCESAKRVHSKVNKTKAGKHYG